MKILIVDKVHDIMLQRFSEANIEYDYFPSIKKAEFDKIISGYQALVIRSKFKVLAEDIDNAKQLKIIGRVGAGLENIDLEYAKSKGIVCLNSPEGNRDAVGEHAVGMLLNLLNKIPKAHEEIKKGVWDRESNWGKELSVQTIGIIGYGNMGHAFGKRISAFSKKVLAYDKYKTGFSDGFVEESDMERLFEEADILSLHVPLTPETRYLVSEQYINKFRKPIVIVNTARGECVDTKELVDALIRKKVTGACLDVLEYEKTTFEQMFTSETPKPLTYLLEAPNVILTPHVAGWTDEAYYKLSDVMARKIINVI